MHCLKLFLIILLLPFTSISQNISAKYSITENISFNLSGGEKIITVNLTGYFYKEANKYIYWEHPDYLLKYLKGKLSFNEDDKIYLYYLNTDTTQMLFYHDYDHNFVRMGLFNENQRTITEYPFVPDIADPWVYGTETKIIQGLKCQLAVFPSQWRVWFCPDIQARTSLRGLQGLPGMIVEADCIPTNEHFKLLDYDLGAKIDAKVFTPNVFNLPMDKGPLLKSIKPAEGKTKLEKRQELSNQN